MKEQLIEPHLSIFALIEITRYEKEVRKTLNENQKQGLDFKTRF